MVGGAAPQGGGVKKGDRGFLAGGVNQGSALEGKHDRAARSEIEILGVHGLPVGGCEGIDQAGGVRRQFQHTMAEIPGGWVKGTIRGLRYNAIRQFGDAAAPPWSRRPSTACVKMRHTGTLR